MKESLFSHYKDLIKETLNVDDFTLNTLEGEYECARPLSFLHIHVFVFYSILTVVSNIVFWFLGIKKQLIEYENDDFLFFSCPDPVFRTKNITLVADKLKYSIIYLPNFHILSSLKYYKYFKNKQINTSFPTFTLKDILMAKKAFRRIDHNIIEQHNLEYVRLRYVVVIYLLYDSIAKRCFKSIYSFKGKCLLEHQKFYFIPIVANLRRLGVESTMLQHGLFFQTVFDYTPLFCDKVLCCSEREKTIYIDNNTQEDRVLVFGSPLQTLSVPQSNCSGTLRFKLLILLTYVDDSNITLVKEVLEFVKSHYNKILVRMRPRSQKDDLKYIGNSLDGMSISPSTSSIFNDIRDCEKVISFSIDANVEVVKQHKPLVYIMAEGRKPDIKDLKVTTLSNYKEEIRKLMTEDFYSTFTEGQYKELLGETDVRILRERFASYIKN